ncbi:toll/interleukin-1 receptor domain-containing protein [Morganella morganii]|nr:toll/interleukin-1 receptor domain-containing protein [Morganella morganii]
MSVFISYRHTDIDIALQIDKKLKSADIITYLDRLDPESQTTDDITSVITKKIAQCSHLIAIISTQTASSWWVPFEIGEATILERRITSYQTGCNSLPEYLDKWPIMKNIQHLELFIDAYNNDTNPIPATERAGMESIGGVFGNSNRAEKFHQELKEKISFEKHL